MDLDRRIGDARIRTSATIWESEWIPARASHGTDGWLFLAERSDHRPGRLIWFVDDARNLRFAGGVEDLADYRYINRWGTNRIVELRLRSGHSVTFAGPRKLITGIIDGYGQALPSE